MSTTQNPADSAANAMRSALLAKRTDAEISMPVKAEDLPNGGGIDYKLIFWEPQVGKTYTIKFLKNLENVVVEGTRDIIHRKVYKHLPDPTRKGKTFQYVSSNQTKGANACKVLGLFFELNALKKDGDALAVQKLDEFMGVTNQACSVIQVLTSPDPTEVGIIRLFTYSSYGPNATIANLLNVKLNPSKEKLADGFEREDVFAIYGTSSMFIECTEADYDGVKGRDYTKSEWSPKKNKGAYVKLADGREHTFVEADFPDGGVTEEALPFFDELLTQLQNPNLSIHNYFAYKTLGDPLNTEDTEKYLQELNAKVDEIVPIIRNAKSIAEIKSYGIGGSTEGGDSAQTISGASAKDILANSVPSELSNSILAAGDAPTGLAAAEPTQQAPPAALTEKSPEIDNILNS